MKSPNRRLFMPVVLAASLLLSPFSLHPAQAAESYSNQWLNPQVRTLSVSDAQILFVQPNSAQLQLFNVWTGEVEWTRKFSVLYDCEVLPASGKIVVLAESNGQLQKQVLSFKGERIGEQAFPNIAREPESQVQWSAAGSGVRESIAVASGDELSVYQYPWKKPVHSLSIASDEDKKDENAGLDEAEFRYLYFVAKMYGLSLMQSRDYYKIVNVSTDKLNLILFPQNVSTHFVTEGANLVVNTSSIPGSLGSATDTPVLYARYNLQTVQATSSSITRTFREKESDWATRYFGGRWLLTDTERGTQSLLTKTGQVIAERTADRSDLSDRLLGYSGGQALILAPLGRQSAEVQAVFGK